MNQKAVRRPILLSDAALKHCIAIGVKIRELRGMHRMSQTALGEKIGVTFQQIQKYEKGQNSVPAYRLKDIADVFGVAVTYFFEGPMGDIGPIPQHLMGYIGMLKTLERLDTEALKVVETLLALLHRRAIESARQS